MEFTLQSDTCVLTTAQLIVEAWMAQDMSHVIARPVNKQQLDSVRNIVATRLLRHPALMHMEITPGRIEFLATGVSPRVLTLRLRDDNSADAH